MKCVFADEQLKHAPKNFLVNGVITPTPEKPGTCFLFDGRS